MAREWEVEKARVAVVVVVVVVVVVGVRVRFWREVRREVLGLKVVKLILGVDPYPTMCNVREFGVCRGCRRECERVDARHGVRSSLVVGAPLRSNVVRAWG